MNVQAAIRVVRTLRLCHRVFANPIKVNKANIVAKKFVIGAVLAARLSKAEQSLQAPKEDVLLEVDALFEQGQYLKLYEKFKDHKDGDSAEMLWRLSRTLYHMSKTAGDQEARAMIYEAYDLISKALSVGNDNSAVHKWYAILLDGKSSYEGKKAQIQQLQTVKDHMMKSWELNPKDATTLYLLGNWCYHVSDLNWYQRKIAAVIFAKPPESSFEEALGYLLKAEETEPNFYSQNLLLLGKTFLKLNRKEEALKYLKLASEYPAKNNDDRDAKKEATKLLSGK